MKFLHIADVHLGKQPDEGTSWQEDSVREIYDGFNDFINYAELNPVDFVFITGDLFDHIPDKNDLFYVDKQFSRLKDTNIIYITGEKDYINRGSDVWDYKFRSRFYLLNGEHFNNSVPVEEKADRLFSDGIVDCVRFEKYNLDIYGICQYNFKNERNDFDGVFIRNLKSINILLAHGGSQDVCPFEPDELVAKKFNYIGVGHLHNFYSHKKSNMYYPGSLEPLGPDEQGEHGFIKGYVDNLITNAKLVSNSYRQYCEINVEADETMTQHDIEKLVEEKCTGKKGYIFTININRKSNCYTDFDLSNIRKKHRVLAVNGEKFPKTELLKLERLNLGNIFGDTLKKIRTSGGEENFSAMKKYADFMAEKIWGDENLGLTPMVTEAEVALAAHKELMAELSDEVDRLTEGLALCHNEGARAKMQLAKYPECTGEINSVRARLKDKKNDFDEVKFKDEQVNKIYSRNRLKFVLMFAFPMAIFFAITCTFGFLEAWFFRALNKWLKFIIVLIIVMVVGGILFYFIYNSTKKLRNRLFGTPIPSVKHSEYGTKMNSISVEIEQLEDELSKLEEINEKHIDLKRILEETKIRQTKIHAKLDDIKTIVEV